jgi:toxin ParE1/3/4
VKLAWSDPAIADRNAIYSYIEADNPRAALALDERFQKVAEMLSMRPSSAAPGRVIGTREIRRQPPLHSRV